MFLCLGRGQASEKKLCESLCSATLIKMDGIIQSNKEAVCLCLLLYVLYDSLNLSGQENRRLSKKLSANKIILEPLFIIVLYPFTIVKSIANHKKQETNIMPTSKLLFKDVATARGTDDDDSHEVVTAVHSTSSPIKHEYEHAALALPFGNEEKATTKTDEFVLDSKPSASEADIGHDSLPSPVKKVSTFDSLQLAIFSRLTIASRALFIALLSSFSDLLAEAHC